MKVLVPGRKQRGWSAELKCTGDGNGGGGCGATLLVEQGDLFVTERHCLHETDYYITFECPCGVRTDLKSPPGQLWTIARAQKAPGARRPGDSSPTT